MTQRALVIVLAAVLAVPGVSAPKPTPADLGPSSAELTGGWALRSANEVGDSGAAIAQVGYDTTGWTPVKLPSTVLAGLVANNLYPNIFEGTNLSRVPDLTTHDWWYRGEFQARAQAPGQAYWLRFKGLSYRAQIWLNGAELDAAAVGTFTEHEYNVTGAIRPGATNALALRITPPRHRCRDLSACTVDWNPEAPDMNAGMWGRTLLETTGPIALRDPYVRTLVPALDRAELSVYVDAINATGAPVTAIVEATISKPGHPTIALRQTVTLAAHERREIAFAPQHVTGPALWWPYQFGTPHLYRLETTATVGASKSDSRAIEFGIREVKDGRTVVDGVSFARYKINGLDFFFKGGGYVWDLLQRWDSRTNTAHINYAKDMGLNTIRLEGTLGNEELYELADRAGVMLMPGFVCCSSWEESASWTAEQLRVATASLETQMRSLRHHASVLMWTFGSDEPPSGPVLARYKEIAQRLHWQNPTLDNVATWSNVDAGMKMDGPYKWAPPVLWWDGRSAGSAFGTNAEQGTEAPPPAESVRKFLAPQDQWPIGAAWNFHTGRPRSLFTDIRVYEEGLRRRYGPPTGLDDFSRKSELQNYETARAFFEAWTANQHTRSFGVIFWMLNNAWPAAHWNLYDYYLKPGGSYFGAQEANEPVHISYDYAGRGVHVVNSTRADRPGLTASASTYRIPDLAPLHSASVPVAAVANSSARVMQLPQGAGAHFIRLRLTEGTAVVSDNLYWYAAPGDAVADRRSNHYLTATTRFADLTGLNALPVNNAVKHTVTRIGVGTQETLTITLRNESPTDIAFFVRPEVIAGAGGGEVLPIDYSSNYVSLFPGESTTVTAVYDTGDLGGRAPHLRLRGYNLPTIDVPAVG